MKISRTYFCRKFLIILSSIDCIVYLIDVGITPKKHKQIFYIIYLTPVF
jgi:hypothetical protein